MHHSDTLSSPAVPLPESSAAGPPSSVSRVPKLSVIVPFYNVQQYAPDTLRSLRMNARRDFEFVLVNDKSKDETPAILDRAAEELSDVAQVQVLHHETNGGLATARNTGLDAARGEYLTFLDGDDWLAPGYLTELVTAIEELGCDFVRTDHVQAVARARTVHRVPIGRRGEVLNPREAILPADRSTSVDYAYAWAGAYHRRLLDKGLLHFTDGLRTAEDRPWIWKLHREAESFAVVSLLGVFYRRGVASSSPRSATPASSTSSAPSTRSSRRRRRTGTPTSCCPRRCAPTARSSPTISPTSPSGSRPWPSSYGR